MEDKVTNRQLFLIHNLLVINNLDIQPNKVLEMIKAMTGEDKKLKDLTKFEGMMLIDKLKKGSE